MKRQRVTRRRYRTLKDYLQETGQSQAAYANALSKRLGIAVQQSTICMIANHQQAASPRVAFAIHDDTGIPLKELLIVESEARRGA